MQCRLSCKTLGGEGAHMYRTHGETHPVRTLMGNTQCGACLREYFTMGKLKAHLIRSDVCRTTLLGRGHCEPVLPGLGSTEDTLRKSAWDNKLPPLAAEGPQLPEGRLRDFEVEHGALYEDIILGVLEKDITIFEHYVRECISRRPISWTLCRRTLQEAHRQCLHGIPDMTPEQLSPFLQTIERLASSIEWPFLLARRPSPVATSLRRRLRSSKSLLPSAGSLDRWARREFSFMPFPADVGLVTCNTTWRQPFPDSRMGSFSTWYLWMW